HPDRLYRIRAVPIHEQGQQRRDAEPMDAALVHVRRCCIVQWRDWLLSRLEREDGPDGPQIKPRDGQTAMEVRGHSVPVQVSETTAPGQILELFGAELGPTPPDGSLPEETYQALLAKADAMGSPLWRQHWERFRAEGRI